MSPSIEVLAVRGIENAGIVRGFVSLHNGGITIHRAKIVRQDGRGLGAVMDARRPGELRASAATRRCSRRALGRQDARQIVDHVTGFFAILADWSRAERCLPANDTAELLRQVVGGQAPPEAVAKALGGREAGNRRKRQQP